MLAAGIICEYNPFHYGHAYHIQKSRECTKCDVLVAVMSGNFVQRGEPAIIDKWERTRVALQHGVDLVLELPFAYATQSATQFAQGSVSTLALAEVSHIVFGSESNDLPTLVKFAHLDTSSYRDFMAGGLSTAQAYEILYGKMNPNDILGINYIQAMEQYGMIPHTIQRTNAYHETSLKDTFASATALRYALLHEEDVSAYTPMQFHKQTFSTLSAYYPHLQLQLLTLSLDYLKTLFLMDEGLENQLKSNAGKYDTFEDFLQASISKRYSASRIRRTLIHLLHHTLKSDIDTLPELSHIRILGFNACGRNYLKELRKKETLQIATRISQIPYPYRKMELKSAQVYGTLAQRKEQVELELQPPIRI